MLVEFLWPRLRDELHWYIHLVQEFSKPDEIVPCLVLSLLEKISPADGDNSHKMSISHDTIVPYVTELEFLDGVRCFKSVEHGSLEEKVIFQPFRLVRPFIIESIDSDSESVCHVAYHLMFYSLSEEITAYLYLKFVDAIFEEKFRYSVEMHEELKVAFILPHCVVPDNFPVNLSNSLCLALRVSDSMIISWIDLYCDRISKIQEFEEKC